MPSYRKRPRKLLPPPPAGGGEQSNATRSIVRGRGALRSGQLAQSSDAEKKLWNFLIRKQVDGLRFRRQFPVGPYFADFICLPARLVIEVDGSQHGLAAQMAHDARRTSWLDRNGFRVIRFPADLVMTDVNSILVSIEGALRQPLPQGFRAKREILSPSRKGRGK